MAYIVLRDNYYTPGLGPLGPGQLGLRYDPTTGNYELKQKSAAGYDIGIGLAIFYQNGSWTSDAISDPKLFENGDPKKPTNEAKRLSLEMNQLVYNDGYIALGGQAGGNKINSAALPQNQSNMGVLNQFPGTNPGIAGAIPALSNPPGFGNIFEGGLPDFGDFPNIQNPAVNKILKYPKDLIETGQDTLHITQVEYQSPYEDVFKTQSFTDILKTGLKRNTVAKTILKGRVILPIPNSAQDQNSVRWGEDNMDAITSALTSYVVKNPATTGGGIAAAYGLAAAAKNTGFSNIIQQIPQAAARFGILSQGNPELVKPALYSFLLNRLGVDVSPETILSRGLGVIPNSNLQLLFNNVDLRSFNFSYMVSPRNPEEAKDINMILRFFKQGMAAKKLNPQAGGASLILGTPNVFKLEYKSGENSIEGMNKFKICALTSFNVNYTPTGQWAAYERGQPASVVMTMNFREIEPVYESDYQSEIPDDLRFDLPSVSIDDIGY